MFERWVANTTTSVTQTSYRAIVRPSCKLLLHGLGQHRAFDVRISRWLRSEFAIKVCRVTLINHIWLECWLVLAVKKLTPVDAVEKVMCLDLCCSIST